MISPVGVRNAWRPAEVYHTGMQGIELLDDYHVPAAAVARPASAPPARDRTAAAALLRGRACATALRALLAQPCAARAAWRRSATAPLQGFLIGSRWLTAGRSRAVGIDYEGHAAEPGDALATYVSMYTALATDWAAAAASGTSFPSRPATARRSTPGSRRALVRRTSAPPVTWSLGAKAPATHGGFTVRRAGPADLDAAEALTAALNRYETGAPMFAPETPEDAAGQRAFLAWLLADPDRACWLAEQEGRPLALVTLRPPGSLSALTLPERSVFLGDAFADPAVRGQGVTTALIGAAMAWARSTCGTASSTSSRPICWDGGSGLAAASVRSATR
ncbi:MAG: GNAT family N-acetyltransferase [Dehalococcoidia bacterium]